MVCPLRIHSLYPFFCGGMYCSAPHGLTPLGLMPRPNSAATSERLSSCSTCSGWTPETVAPGRRKSCALPSACRIAWTAIEKCGWTPHSLLLDVARGDPAYKREGLLTGSRLQLSHGVAGKICYASSM